MIAFKEWQVVCNALASGRQSLIFRKGGIHEGREGFSFKEENFFLFPTRFHSQNQQVTVNAGTPLPEWQPGDELEITHFATAEWAETFNEWAQVDALTKFHIWTEECLRDRFNWSDKGMSEGSIHVAFLRIYKLANPLNISYQKSLGGCRSWVELPLSDDLEIELVPVLTDDEHTAREKEIRAAIKLASQ